MPSKTQQVGPSQTYQRFAWVTLGMAGLVALFSADNGAPAAAAPSMAPAQPVSSAPPMMPARSPFASAQSAPPLAEADASEPDAAAGAETDPAAAASPPAPGAGSALPEEAGVGPEAGPPSAAEAGQMLSASRNRSGAVDQGDETLPAPGR